MMRSVPSQILTLMLCLSPFACSDDTDRQEQVISLRSFGMSSEPLVATPTLDPGNPKFARITIYASVPLGQTATILPFADTGNPAGAVMIPASDITVIAGSETYVDYNKFRLFSAQANVKIPLLAALSHGPLFSGGQIRYGLTIESAGVHEDVIANIAVFPEGAPETNWANPKLDITSMTEGSSFPIADDVDLAASIENTNAESLKIGWFVSSGEVSNRRASATKWKIKERGNQTVTVVVHGIRSRGFALKVINVTGI